MINAETIAWLRGSMNGKPAKDAELADALETLARAYLADAGDDAPQADLARAILGEERRSDGRHPEPV